MYTSKNKNTYLNNIESIDWVMISLAFTAVIISYGVYLINMVDTMTSDTATEILLGREMWLQKSLFPKDFYYSTELFLLRTPLFVALWSFFFEDILSIYRFTVVTEVLLETAALIYLLRSLPLGIKSTLLGVLVFFGARTFISSHFIGMGGTTYATMHITIVLALGYYVNRIQGVNGKFEKTLRFIIPILALNFGLSSVKMLIILFFPILFVHICLKFYSKQPVSFKKDSLLWEIILWNVIYLIGYNITIYYIMPKGFGPLYFQSSYSNGISYIVTEGIPGAIREIIRANPVYTIMIPFKFNSLAFLNGFLGSIYFIVLIFCFIYSSKKCTGSQGSLYVILLYSIFLTSFSMILFQPGNSFQMRYIMVAYVFAAIIISHSYERIIYANIKVGRALVLFLSIFMISNGIYNSLQIEVFKERNFSKIINQNSDKIEEAFLKHGIKRGYSLYWDSSTVNVLSNNRVELAPVSGDMTPHTVMAPYRYYSSDQTNEKTAFVKVIQPIEGNKSDHPEFVISNQSIFDLAVDKEVIYENGAPLIEIYYFDKNYFTFSPDNDPKRKIS